MQVSTGLTTATVNGSLPVFLSGVALSRLSNSKFGTGTVTLGTVGVGKKWRIMAYSLQVSTAAESGSVRIDANSVRLAGGNCITSSITYGMYETSLNLGSNYVELTAGQTVTLVVSGAACNGHATVFYEELTA